MADIRRRLARIEMEMATLPQPHTDDVARQLAVIERTSVADRTEVIAAMRRLRGTDALGIHCEFAEIAPLLPEDVRARVAATIRAVDDEAGGR